MYSKYILGTRGSALALWQAHYVSDLLKGVNIPTEIKVIKTSGDIIKDKLLSEIGGKGVFVKELEQALLNKTVDIAVHSLKDLPAQTLKPFALPCFLPRHPAEDLIIFSPIWAERLADYPHEIWQSKDLKALGPLKIGTGSLRRESLLREASSEIRTVAIRGNVDTRIANLKAGKWDAIVLAKASLYRIPISKEFPCFTLDSSWFIPCAGQGALVIESLEDHPIHNKLRQMTDYQTESVVSVERKILSLLGGDCNLPVGVHVFYHNKELCCDLVVYNSEGRGMRMYITQGESSSSEEFVGLIWEELKHSGVDTFLKS